MNACFNQKVELISILQYLGKYKENCPTITNEKTEFTSLIDNWFYEYKDHQAVQLTYDMSNVGFNYHKPFGSVLNNYSKSRKLCLIDYLEYFQNNIPIYWSIEKYIKCVNNFYEDTKFGEFLYNSEKLYNKVLNGYSSLINNLNVETALMEYYGYKPQDYLLVFASIVCGNFGVEIIDRNINYYCSVIGLNGSVDNDFLDSKYLHELVWHEYGHSYINKCTKNNPKVIELEYLFENVKENMCKNGNAYSSWESCLSEHIVRAVTNRMVRKYFGEDEYLKNNKRDKDVGFWYIDKIENSLIKYENNRRTNNNFSDFFNALLEEMEA